MRAVQKEEKKYGHLRDSLEKKKKNARAPEIGLKSICLRNTPNLTMMKMRVNAYGKKVDNK